MNKFHVFLSLLAVTFIISCGGDSALDVDMKKLPGKWNLLKAERNGQATSTLDKAYFNITSDKFSHNLNGDSVAVNYKIVNKTLEIEDSMLSQLDILQLVGDTMKAETKIGKFNFKFLMSKNATN